MLLRKMQNAHCIYSMSICIYLYLSSCVCVCVRVSFWVMGWAIHKSQCCQNGITSSDKHDTQLSIDISRFLP